MILIEPVKRTIELPHGGTKDFIISRFDAISGRKLVTQYPSSGVPKLGDYDTNEAIMLQMMTFVEVPTEGGANVALQTRELVNNHVPDWETLMKLEWEIMEYNCSFFANGKVSNFLGDLAEKVPGLILSMLTDLLEQSPQADKPPSTS